MGTITIPSNTTPNVAISDIHQWLPIEIQKDIVSNVYEIPTLLHALGVLSKQKTYIPGTDEFIGKSLSFAEQMLDSGAEYKWPFKMARTSNGKTMSEFDTGPSGVDKVALDDVKILSVGWARETEGLSVPASTVLMEDGKAVIGAGAVAETARAGMSELMSRLSGFLWTSAPADTTKVITGLPIGVETWVHNANTILGVDRTLAGNAAFRGNRSTAALPASLSLIDRIVRDGVDDGAAGTTQPILKWGGFGDLVICTPDVFGILKAEANGLGVQVRLVNQDEANMGNLGFLKEYFYHNGRLFVPDYSWSGTKKLAVLDSKTWRFRINKKKAFTMFPWKNLRENAPNTGQTDAVTSELEVMYQLICREPRLNFVGNNVS